MATKPTATFTHATNLNYSLGPAVGFPTKLPVPDIPNGFVPGTGVSAEQVNQLINITGQWITDWLALGSAASGLDAHLVETNALGAINTAAATFGGTAAALTPLVVGENSGAPGLTAQLQNSSVGGIVTRIEALGAGSSIAVEANALFGTSNAIQATTGAGIAVRAESVGGGTAVRAIGNAAGPGLVVTAGNASTAITATGDVASGRASVECNMATGSIRAPLRVGTQAVGPSGTFQGDVSMPADNGDVLTVHQRHPNTGVIGAGRGLWGNGQGMVAGVRSNLPFVDVIGAVTVNVATKTVTMRTGQTVMMMAWSPLGGTGAAGLRGTVNLEVDQPTLGTVTMATHGLRFDGAAAAPLGDAYMSEAAMVSFTAAEDGAHTFRLEHVGAAAFTTRWLVPSIFILGDTTGL